MISVYHSPAYTLAAHEYSTTRKAGWIADSLRRNPLSGVALVEPEPLAFEQVAEVHDPAYVCAIQTGEPREAAESQGFGWDHGLWDMVLASNGGVGAAVFDALKNRVSGSLSSGLHHARRNGGDGNCTFNGLVIGAKAAIAAGAKSILILDLDAHCGGGTHSLIAGDSRTWQLDVSVASFDSYEPGERTSLDIVQSASNYLPTIERRLEELEANGPVFDLCIYNAGMDPHENCPVGGMTGIDAEILRGRERLVFGWCERRRIPVAFVLAGGYVGSSLSVEDLVALHRLTIASAAKRPTAAD
ncbi:MAG: hypothetical protein WKF55_00045 [Gemmatimonadaceae bacterium]